MLSLSLPTMNSTCLNAFSSLWIENAVCLYASSFIKQKHTLHFCEKWWRHNNMYSWDNMNKSQHDDDDDDYSLLIHIYIFSVQWCHFYSSGIFPAACCAAFASLTCFVLPHAKMHSSCHFIWKFKEWNVLFSVKFSAKIFETMWRLSKYLHVIFFVCFFFFFIWRACVDDTILTIASVSLKIV